LNELDDFEHKANPTTTDYDVWAAMKEATGIQPGTHIGKYGVRNTDMDGNRRGLETDPRKKQHN